MSVIKIPTPELRAITTVAARSRKIHRTGSGCCIWLTQPQFAPLAFFSFIRSRNHVQVVFLSATLLLAGSTASSSLLLQHKHSKDPSAQSPAPPLEKQDNIHHDQSGYPTTEFPKYQVEKASALLPNGNDESQRQKRLLNHRKLQLASDKGSAIENQYIVTFEPGVVVSSILLAVAKQNGRTRQGTAANAKEIVVGMQNRMVYSSDVVAIFKDLPEDDLLVLLDNPQVVFAEQDQVVKLDYRQKWAPWHLDKIDEPRSKLDFIYEYTLQGSDVDVYIVDSGIQIDHSEFGGRARCGFNAFAATEQGCQDVEMHGTHVASIVGGATYGVAKNVELISVKVVNANNGEGGSVGTVIGGLDYVMEQKRANPDRPAVANVSLGSGASVAFNEAIDRAVAAGIIVVNSAGNDGVDACTRSPSSAVNSITVGSIGRSNHKSAFSNYGSCVDIFAPGEGVTGASPALFGSSTLSGTSMSSPVVAGVAALYLERDPSLSPDGVWREMHSAAAVGLVQDNSGSSPDLIVSVDNLNNPGGLFDSSGECKGLLSSCSSNDECCWSCNSWLLFHRFCFFF